jgi:hypothetical protein
MQEMWEKVHSQRQRKKMIHNDFSFNDFFYWDDPGLPLRNIGLIRELHTFEKSTHERLTELEKEPRSNKELIMQEKTILEATQKEIRRLERQSFYSQLGPH